jgi:hypothetical protein
LQEIAIRILGRHFQDALSSDYQFIFDQYINKIKMSDTTTLGFDYRGEPRFTAKKALQEIGELQQQPMDVQQQDILNELTIYIKDTFIVE